MRILFGILDIFQLDALQFVSYKLIIKVLVEVWCIGHLELWQVQTSPRGLNASLNWELGMWNWELK